MTERKKQASNIDEQGNVLYLDQERLDRKEVGFPPYRNKSNGLGIYNWLLEHVIYMSRKRWPLALKLYRMFVKFSVWMKEGGWKARLYKTGIMLYPDMERPTSTVVMPSVIRSSRGTSFRTAQPPYTVAAFMVCPLGKE